MKTNQIVTPLAVIAVPLVVVAFLARQGTPEEEEQPLDTRDQNPYATDLALANSSLKSPSDPKDRENQSPGVGVPPVEVKANSPEKMINDASASTNDSDTRSDRRTLATADDINDFLIENAYSGYTTTAELIETLNQDAVKREDWLSSLLDNPNAIPPLTDYVLSQLPMAKLDDFLGQALNSKNTALQQTALLSMRMHREAAFKNRELLGPVLNTIQSEYSDSITQTALKVLGDQGNKDDALKTNQQVLDNLKLALRSDSTDTRHTAITALLKLKDAEEAQHQVAQQAIMSELTHSDASVRETAIIQLDVWLDYIDASEPMVSAVVRHLALARDNNDAEEESREMREITTILSYLPLSPSHENELSLLGYL